MGNIVSVGLEKVLLVVKVIYSTPGFSPTLIDNVMSFGYDSDPNRLVVHHDANQQTDIMADNIRLVHVSVQ